MAAAAWQSVQVEECDYQVNFQGYHRPLKVALEGGQEVDLQPWSMRDNLYSLGRHISLKDALPDINVTGYAFEVMNLSNIPEHHHAWLAPLAMWWAAGGIEPLPLTPLGEQRFRAGQYVFELRAWSAGERMDCLAQALRQPSSESRYDFDHVRYLQGLLQRCIVAVVPEVDVMQVDTATMLVVLDQIFSLNQQHEGNPPADDTVTVALELSPYFSSRILKLCSVLGWSPEQLLALPAKQLDQLFAMVEHTSPKTQPSHSSTGRIGYGTHDVLIKIDGE